MTPERRFATGAAPGKVILLGEHSVVYGYPAIAAALGHGLGSTVLPSNEGPVLRIPRWGQGGLKVRPTASGAGVDSMGFAFHVALNCLGLDDNVQIAVTIDGELPLGVGLGSSAAFAVCLIRGLARFFQINLSSEHVLSAAEHVERVFHGNPSGLDHTVVATGQCLHYHRSPTPIFSPIRLSTRVPLVIAWTQRQGTTKEAVAHLRSRHEQHPALYDDLFKSIGRLIQPAIEALEHGDLKRLGALFDINHGYLNACGISHPANEEMVHIARKHGALGAKLTGAGRGGASIAIAPNGSDKMIEALNAAGYGALFTTLEP